MRISREYRQLSANQSGFLDKSHLGGILDLDLSQTLVDQQEETLQALEQAERRTTVMSISPDRDPDFEDQENEGADPRGRATGRRTARSRRKQSSK